MYFNDGSRSVTADVNIGPDSTRLVIARPEWIELSFGRGRPRYVRTESVERVEMRRGPKPWKGSAFGFAIGAAPGALLLTGELSGVEEFQTDSGLAPSPHLLLAMAGGLIGYNIGTAVDAASGFHVIYQGPVTRYPDAALVLMQAPPEPLADSAAPEAGAHPEPTAKRTGR